MRVMLVTNGLGYGGAERVVEALAVGLNDRGHAVHVVATTRGGPIRDSLREGGIAVSVLSIRSRLDLRVPAKLANVARKFSPDVIHSHLAVADIAAAIANIPLGRRLVTTVHNPGVELDPFKRTLWRRALGSFDRVTAVSRTVADSVRTFEPELLYPSLVDLDEPPLTRAEARSRLGLTADRPLVLGVGRLAPIKGFDVLAEAASRMTTDPLVAVIGDGPDRPTLVNSNLTLLGAMADAGRLLAAADIVVCPSRSEGFPQVPLQAMAAGVAVVATRVGGTPEIVEDGITGRLVPPEDPDALALAIDQLLEDDSTRDVLGRAGRRRLAERGLTRTAMIDRAIALYTW